MTEYIANIDIASQLTHLDWIVFLGAGVACAAIVLYGNRKKQALVQTDTAQTASLLEYLLMGRQLTLPLFVATLVATWYGGIFGVTQIAFEQGIYNLFTQGIFWYITYIIFALYIVKKVRAFNAATLSDLIKNIYGHKAAKLSALLVFFKTLPVAYAISIGLLLQSILPLNLLQATICGVILIVLYALSGGLRTIVYSDVALFIIMCLGVLSVLVFSICTFGSLSFLQTHLPASYFQPCGTNSIATTLAWFFIACSTTFVSPSFYQRCLAAQNTKVAVKGILISTVIWFCFDICTTFGAMYAKAVLPETDSLNAYITYSVQLLPSGFRGLLLASIAASIIAALDSFLFIASNVLLYDLNLIKIGNLKLRHITAICATATLTIIIAISFEGKIESAWLILKSYFSACLFLPILLSYVTPKFANGYLFATNCVITCTVLTLWQVFFTTSYPGINAFYIGTLSTGLIFASFYVATYLPRLKTSTN